MYKKNFNIIKRVRRPSPNPRSILRLNRAEFGQDYNKKKIEFDNFYPDSEVLIARLSEFHKIKKNQITLGLGAESIIKDLLMTLSMIYKKPKVLNFVPNYFMYSLYCNFFRIKEYCINHDPKKTKEYFLKKIFGEVKKKKINIIIIVNPSSPFEINFTKEDITNLLNFCKREKVFLVLDEVYQLLGSKSSINLVNKFNNLIIIRSFSKGFGYPGLRIGYAISNYNFLKKLESSRLAIELPSQVIEKGVLLLKKYKTEISKRILNIIKARAYAHNEFKKRKINSYNFFSNTVSFEFNSEKEKNKICKKIEEKKIFFNYNYNFPLNNFANLTTTNIKNLKKFFTTLDVYYK